MKGNLIIFGASGHGKVVADAAQASGWKVAGWADDDPEKRQHQHIADLPVLATSISNASRHALKHGLSVVVAIGDNLSRKQVFSAFEESRVPIATVIHPSAVLSPRVSIGTGTVIFAGAIVNPDTVVGRNVIINTSASIDHDNRIGDHAHISPGANLGGLVTVGDGTHIVTFQSQSLTSFHFKWQRPA